MISEITMYMYTLVWIMHFPQNPGVHNEEPTAHQAAKGSIAFSGSTHTKKNVFLHYAFLLTPICKVLGWWYTENYTMYQMVQQFPVHSPPLMSTIDLLFDFFECCNSYEPLYCVGSESKGFWNISNLRSLFCQYVTVVRVAPCTPSFESDFHDDF